MIRWILVLSFIFLGAAFAAPSFAAPASKKIKEKCHVEITYQEKTGVTSKSRIDLVAKTKKECFRKAAIYKHNTTPQLVSSKKVQVVWK